MCECTEDGPRLRVVRRVGFDAMPRFAVREVFREGEVTNGLKVIRVNDNFREHFWEVVEEGVPKRSLLEYELVVASRDTTIVNGLGGDNKAQSFLAHFWQSLERADPSLWIVHFAMSPRTQTLLAVHGYFRNGEVDVEACRPLRDTQWKPAKHGPRFYGL